MIQLILILATKTVFSDKIGEENDVLVNCREKVRLIGLDKDDQFEFITAKLNSRVMLWCHYCKQGVTYAPKVWYKQSSITDDTLKEVELGMDSALSDNRVCYRPDHTLVINRVIEGDAGLYFCHGPNEEQEDYKYNYVLDVVPERIPLMSGTLEEWKMYSQATLKEANDKFANSQVEDYSEIRTLGVKIHLVYELTRWGPCNGCYKVRRRFDECRMKTQSVIRNTTVSAVAANNKTEDILRRDKKILNLFELSCHSVLFAKYYSKISSELMKIQNYVFTEPCFAPCRLEGSKTAAKYRNTVTLTEGDHLTLICPGATIDNEVVWTKNGITIPENSVEENIRVDSLFSLYISHATNSEDANYTCFINEVKIQEVIVVVHVKSIINSEAFQRHIQYLGFIFIFSVIFYTAGLIISYTKRDAFKKINFAKLEEKRAHQWFKVDSEEEFSD